MTKFVFNSIKAFSMCSITAFMFACSQEDNFEYETNGHNREQESFFNGEIEVHQDGYLSFKSDEVFKDYINLINEKQNGVLTRASQLTIPGFTSIASLKERIELTRSENGSIEDDGELEEMTQEEFNTMKAEDLLHDPVLTEVLDTTLRIKVEDRIYKITQYGTFSALSSDAIHIDNAIEKFDTTLMNSTENGEYIELENAVTFTNTFGNESIEEGELELIEEAETRSTGFNMHEGYNVKTYQYKNNSVWQKIWDNIRGKDVKKEHNFTKKRRVQVNVFDVNYGFYASAGIKVKMQKRKKFLFVKYWVSEDAEKLAIGFNKVYGVLKLTNPRSFSSIVPTTSTTWGKFSGAINNISSSFIFGQYKKFSVVKDWVDDIYMILPEITLNGEIYPNKDIMNKLYLAPADKVCDFLNKQVNSLFYKPISKNIQPKDPRISYFVWGNTSYSFEKEKSYIMGVKEYGKGSSKTVRFDQSFGFSINGLSLKDFQGFLPSKFSIEDIDAFGAAYYNGTWKGVRIKK